jgi:hypothetical protein
MSLYLYCVSDSRELTEPSLEGIAGSRLSWVDCEDLYVLTSDFDRDLVPVSRENVLKHAAVIARVLESSSPLPFRFGTLASTEQLSSFMRARRSALQKRLAFVRNRLEMSVKIIWEKGVETESREKASTEAADGVGIGTAFLTKKRRELEVGQTESKRATELSAWLSSRIGNLVKDEVVTLRPNEKLVFSGAHLLERESILQYREIMANLAVERPELRFLVSGPWAPYSFANIDLEFDSHFRVS